MRIPSKSPDRTARGCSTIERAATGTSTSISMSVDVTVIRHRYRIATLRATGLLPDRPAAECLVGVLADQRGVTAH